METASWERARPEQAECGRPHWGRTSSTEGPGELSLEADPRYHFLQPLRDPLQLHRALSGETHPPKAPNSVAGRGQAGGGRQMRLLPPGSRPPPVPVQGSSGMPSCLPFQSLRPAHARPVLLHSSVSYQGLYIDQASEDRLLATPVRDPGPYPYSV